MKTENEIKALSLVERQKLFIELKQIGTNDKAYSNAKTIIGVIEEMKDWSEPELIEVKNISGGDLALDDGKVKVAKDATIKVLPWQYVALARFLEPVDEEEGAAVLKAYLPKPAKETAAPVEPAKPALDEKAVAKLVTQTVAETIKQLGIKTAVLLFALLIGFGLSARATTTQAFGSPGSYNGLYVAGLNGGTNSIPTNTVTTYTAPTFLTNSISQVVWTNINGIQTPSTNTVITSIITNVPGLFRIPSGQPFTLSYGSALFGAAGQSLAKVSYTPDGVTFQTNYWTLPLTANSANEVISTNIFVPAMAGGWGRLDSLSGLVTSGGTNTFFLLTTGQ